MMAMNWEWKLKAINIFCQGYFFTFSLLTVILGFKMTLPEFCDRDEDCLLRAKLLVWFIFINMGVNYICIGYKSKFSKVKTSPVKAHLSSSSSSSFAKELPPTAISPMSFSWAENNINNNGGLTSEDLYENMMCESQKHRRMFESLNYSSEGPNNYGSVPDHKRNHSNDTYTLEITHGTIPTIADWQVCRDCNVSVPPRAKHCPLCHHCVLKRDHHCFFAGCCIGFHNQRFFTIFCLYSGLGGIYNCIVVTSYLKQHYEALDTWGYLAYFLPILLVFWLMGWTSSSVVLMILFLFWSLVTTCVCCYYFCVQMFLVIRGQTSYECMKGIRTYRATVWKNWVSVFGRFWPVGFFVPVPFLGYQGNGVSWNDLCSDLKTL